MIRTRGQRDHFKVVKQLDAFSKVPDECRATSRIGGFGMNNLITLTNRN